MDFMPLNEPEHRQLLTALRGTADTGRALLMDRMDTAFLRGLAEAFKDRHVLLDCRNIGSLDSSDLGTLVGLDRKLRASGGRLTLCNVRPRLYEVFDRTRLTTWMDVRPGDPETASS
jgi:anti-anti-sigma factor